jgi:hypothetical protein
MTHENYLYFLNVENKRLGADARITPREIIRDFIGVLNIAQQYPDRTVEDILGSDFDFAKPLEEEDIDEPFVDFEV